MLLSTPFRFCRYWNKFANWPAFNASNMLDVLIDDAIPTLQTALGTLWNSSNTAIYFDFLKNVRRITVVLALSVALIKIESPGNSAIPTTN